MKKLYYILILLWIVTEISCISQIIYYNTDINGNTLTTTNPVFDNIFKFNIPISNSRNSDLKFNANPQPPDSYHLTFWEFGDGTFSIEATDMSKSSPTITNELIHNYDKIHVYQSGLKDTCIAHVLKVKDTNDPPPDRLEAPICIGPNRNTTLKNEPVPMDGKHIKISTYPFDAVFGHPFFIILTYDNCTNEEDYAKIHGEINFTFNTTYFNLVNIKKYNSEEIEIDSTSGMITFKYKMEGFTSDSTQHNIFIELKPLIKIEDNSKNDSTAVSVEIVNTLIERFDGCKPKPTDNCGIIQDQLYVDFKKSHDPNTKTATMIKQGNTHLIEYRTKFQNIDKGAVDTIIIKEFIPNALKGLTIDIDNAEYDDKQLKLVKDKSYYNDTTNIMTWMFLMEDISKNLRGLQESDFGFRFGVPDTEGWLTYTIEVEPDSIKYPCQTILSQSYIFFDSNELVATNAAVASFNCNSEIETEDCLPDNCVLKRNIRPPSILQIENDSTTSFIAPEHILNNLSSARWYPYKPSMTNLNNQGLQVPNFYFTYSDNCTRWIVDYPIYISNN